MFEKAIEHVEKTWSDVLHGDSTTSEKVECGAEALAAAAVIGVAAKVGMSEVSVPAEHIGVLPNVEVSGKLAKADSVFDYFNPAFSSKLGDMDLPNIGTSEAPLFRTPAGVELSYAPSKLSSSLQLNEARVLPNSRAASALSLKPDEGRVFWMQPSGASHAGDWAYSSLGADGRRSLFLDELSPAGVVQASRDGTLRWNWGQSFGTNDFRVLQPNGAFKSQRTMIPFRTALVPEQSV